MPEPGGCPRPGRKIHREEKIKNDNLKKNKKKFNNKLKKKKTTKKEEEKRSPPARRSGNRSAGLGAAPAPQRRARPPAQPRSEGCGPAALSQPRARWHCSLRVAAPGPGTAARMLRADSERSLCREHAPGAGNEAARGQRPRGGLRWVAAALLRGEPRRPRLRRALPAADSRRRARCWRLAVGRGGLPGCTAELSRAVPPPSLVLPL